MSYLGLRKFKGKNELKRQAASQPQERPPRAERMQAFKASIKKAQQQ